MKKYFFNFCFILFAATVVGQSKFISSGKIEFERKTNVYRLFFNDMEGSFMEMIKKATPQFRTDYFDLLFTESNSLYKPGRESDEPKKGLGFFGNAPGSDNIVYKDLQNETAISTKQVYESKFLLSDSLRHVDWKLQPETRTIAGFECRKAVGRICDSVVVVAFYTDEIVPATGPESFCGLPGMILEIAIPRLYTTWVATKLELIESGDEKKISPPTKGKKANQKDMLEKVNDAIKDWGDKYRDRSIWLSSL